MTLGSAWGWTPNPGFKTARRVIGTLAEITAKGGCLALGVGPTPDGVIEEKAIVILQEIGQWMRRCGEAIYATRITDNYNCGNIWFNASKDGKTLYAIYALPDGESLPATLEWTGNLPKESHRPQQRQKVKAVVKDGKVTIKLPKGLADEPIALKFNL